MHCIYLYSYLEEYLKCTGPIAKATTQLQGEQRMTYGHLLPTLISLKNDLEDLGKRKEFIYCEPLLEGIVFNLTIRFKHLFAVTKEGKVAAVAAAVHPYFKNLDWMLSLTPEAQLNAKLAINDIILTTGNEIDEEQNVQEMQNLLKNYNFGNRSSSGRALRHELYGASPAEIQLNKYSKETRMDYDLLNNYPAVKEIFLRTNTPLPSSAPAERLFSFATMYDILKYNRYTNENFDMRILSKANTSKKVNDNK